MDRFTGQADGLKLRPAVVATCVWVGVGLALDAYLLVKQEDYLITDVLRTKVGKVGMAVLGLHVVNCLGKADPFRAAAAVVNWRLATVAARAAEVAADAVDAVVPALTDAQPGK